MNKKFIYYGFAIGFPQIITFATLLVLSSNLSNVLYAKIALFETVIFFLQATIGLAIGRSVSRFYIDGNGDDIISIASSVVIFSSISLFLISSLIISSFHIFNRLEVSYLQYTMLYISSVGYILTAISLVKYQFTNQVIKFLFLSVFKTAQLFIAIYVSIVILDMSVDAFPLSHFLAGSSLIIVSIFINRPRLIKLADIEKVKNMLSYSLPFVPTLIAAWVMSWSNRFFMVGEVSAGDIGIYSIIQRFCMMYFIFTQAVSVFITPVIYRKLKNGMSAEVSNISIKLMVIYFIVCAILSLALSYFLVWYYKYDYSLTLTFVGMLMVVNLLSSITAVSTNILLNYHKKTLIQMYVYLCISVLTLVLNYFLIPEFKMYGVFISLVFPLVILNFLHVFYFFSTSKYVNVSKILFVITLIISFVAVSILTYSDSL